MIFKYYTNFKLIYKQIKVFSKDINKIKFKGNVLVTHSEVNKHTNIIKKNNKLDL